MHIYHLPKTATFYIDPFSSYSADRQSDGQSQTYKLRFWENALKKEEGLINVIEVTDF
jgi:hypothetical protein